MAFEDIQFPLYRKYKNNSSFFRIISPNLFEEIQMVGTKAVFHQIKATKLPEMNHVFDLVYGLGGLTLESTENEYLEMLKKVKN